MNEGGHSIVYVPYLGFLPDSDMNSGHVLYNPEYPGKLVKKK